MSDAKLIPEPPLLVLPSLAAAVGLNEAIVLQQLHFRTRVAGEDWWQASAAQLRREFPFWSEATIKRTIASLRRDGLVQVRQVGVDRTNRYQIRHAALARRTAQIAPMDRRSLSTNRADGSAQGALLAFKGKRNVNGKTGDAPAPGKYGNVSRRLEA